jgi:hypothetical protein
MKKASAFLLTIGLIFLFADSTAQGSERGGQSKDEL